MNGLSELLATLKDLEPERVLDGMRERGIRLEAYPLSSYAEIHAEYLRELDQKENFCGAFAAAYILRGLGFREHEGEKVDQDYVALLARVNVSPDDLERLEKLKAEVRDLPEAEAEKLMRENRGIWYRFTDLPTTRRPEELGASAEGVARAIEEISSGLLKPIPLKTCDKSAGALLTPERMRGLLGFIKRDARRFKAQLILNLNTAHLLDSEKIGGLSERLLLGEKIPEVLREPVGHFVSCGGLLEVEVGGNVNDLLIIRETYSRYGAHLQPAENVRRALCRGDGREGGVLVIVPSEFEGEARKALGELGLPMEFWDNGSPYIPPTSRRTS